MHSRRAVRARSVEQREGNMLSLSNANCERYWE